MAKAKGIHRIGVELSHACEWEGKKICKAFVEALTDANFHTLRRKVVPGLNRELGMKMRYDG